MNTKTMEGLIGAGTNMELVNTPMRVFKEARRRGDTATMERAMGYASEFADKAETYKIKAGEGTQEDAKESRKEAEQAREEAIEKRREERREQAEELKARREDHSRPTGEAAVSTPESQAAQGSAGQTGNAMDNITDTVEISEEGKILSKGIGTFSCLM